MNVCKMCAEALELRIVKYQYMVEKYLSIFADVSNMPHAVGDENFLILLHFYHAMLS